MRKVSAIALLALLSGCLPAAKKQTAIADADAKMVEDCQFVGEVNGTSGFAFAAAELGVSRAQNQARQAAAKLGATHIVWGGIGTSWGSSASGKAYRCGVG